MKKNFIRRCVVTIPLTRSLLHIFIAENPQPLYRATCKLFGFEDDDVPRFHARAVRGNGRFGLYFHAHGTDHDDIAHEVTHIVTYILDYLGHDFNTCDEFGPRLAGFAAAQVYREFKKAGLRIKL